VANLAVEAKVSPARQPLLAVPHEVSAERGKPRLDLIDRDQDLRPQMAPPGKFGGQIKILQRDRERPAKKLEGKLAKQLSKKLVKKLA
jgi:hypothetical protein